MILSGSLHGRLATVALIALAALVPAACGGDEDGAAQRTPTTTVAADRSNSGTVTAEAEAGDVAVRIDIPDGALPAGVDRSVIRVTTLSMAKPEPLAARNPDADQELSPVVAVFELEPAGLRFLRPVTLTFRLPSDIASGPLAALHASEEGVEPLRITLTDRPGSGQIEISTTVEHFSKVFIVRAFIDAPDVIDVKVEAPETVMVGSEFTVTADFERLVGTRTVNVHIRVDIPDEEGEEHPYSHFIVPYELTVERGSWTLGGHFTHLSRDVTPQQVTTPSITLRGDTHHEDATFTCETEGRWAIFHQGDAVIRYGAVPASPPAGVELPQFESAPYRVQFSANAPGRCVMPRIVATLAAPLTTYTLSPAPPDEGFEYSWTGADCGTTAGDTTATYVWSHGGEDCKHVGEAHPDSLISVLVRGTFPASGEPFELRCTYRSAASGEGAECTLTR